MDGSALLTCPDLCNHVWPSAFPQLHLKFVNINNIYISFPFSHSPVKEMHFTNYTDQIILSAPGLLYCLTPILHFSHFTGFWLQIIVHTHPLSWLFFPLCFNCILYSAIFSVKPQYKCSTRCVHPSTPAQITYKCTWCNVAKQTALIQTFWWDFLCCNSWGK